MGHRGREACLANSSCSDGATFCIHEGEGGKGKYWRRSGEAGRDGDVEVAEAAVGAVVDRMDDLKGDIQAIPEERQRYPMRRQ